MNPRFTSQVQRFFPLLLAIITMIVFWPAVKNEFVNYDDPDYVTKNVAVQKGLTGESIGWAFTSGHASNWHPLTWLSHMLDWELSGDNPKGHHITSVLFHSLNAGLLFLLMRNMTGFFWRSAFVAALFALHPLRVESVAWISERKDVLSTFFGFLSLWCYSIYAQARRDAATTKNPQRFFGLTLLFFALSLMSKPMLVTLPFLLLLLDIWPFNRIRLEAFLGDRSSVKPLANEADERDPLRCVMMEKLPFFALIIASSIVTFLVQQKGGAVSGALTLGARIANALVAYCRYLGKLVWPENLSVLYPHPGSWPSGVVICAGLFLLLVSALATWQLRRRPWFFVGWFWFIGTAVPVIGIVQVGIQSMADRYTYIPMIGVYIVLTWAVAEITAKIPGRCGILGAASAVLFFGCIHFTQTQIKVWRNSMTLFEHAVAVTDKNYLAYNNLGFFLSEEARNLRGQERLRKIDEAIDRYRKSVEIKPNYEEALNNLGHALAEKGQHAEAIPFFRAALNIKSNLFQAHNNLGNALSEVGQMPEAIEHYRIVLAKEPDNVDAHNNLGVALAMQGEWEVGMDHLKKAARLNPKNASARSNLGNAYAMQGKLDLAAEEFRAALELNPTDSRTHNNLANVFAGMNKLDEAIGEYRKALELEPINPEANFNLGLAFARKGDRESAVKHTEEALRLRPNYPDAQRQLMRLREAK